MLVDSVASKEDCSDDEKKLCIALLLPLLLCRRGGEGFVPETETARRSDSGSNGLITRRGRGQWWGIDEEGFPADSEEDVEPLSLV